MSWRRVSKRCPCPVCGRDHYCTISADGTAALCTKIASAVDKRTDSGGGGWLHWIGAGDNGTPRPLPPIAPEPPKVSPAELVLMDRRYRSAVDADRLHRLADSLGLSVSSLRRLGIGWDAGGRQWTFPMHNAAERIIGFRTRGADGRKRAIPGSHNGLFIPAKIASGLLILPEGPTSTAALLCLGLPAVGRPNNNGGAALAAGLVRRLGPAQVVLLGDNDERFSEQMGCYQWPGRDGAVAVAGEIARRTGHRHVRVVMPPEGIKDARDWLKAGAAAADVIELVNRACTRSAEEAYAG